MQCQIWDQNSVNSFFFSFHNGRFKKINCQIVAYSLLCLHQVYFPLKLNLIWTVWWFRLNSHSLLHKLHVYKIIISVENISPCRQLLNPKHIILIRILLTTVVGHMFHVQQDNTGNKCNRIRVVSKFIKISKSILHL